MTLAYFRHLTEFLPPDTPILVLNADNQPTPAAVVDVDELDPDDPVRDHFPLEGILLEAVPAD